jgi:hypothetical protein
MLTSEHKRKIQQRVETCPFKISSPRGEGESKRKRKFNEKDTVVGLGFSPQN